MLCDSPRKYSKDGSSYSLTIFLSRAALTLYCAQPGVTPAPLTSFSILDLVISCCILRESNNLNTVGWVASSIELIVRLNLSHALLVLPSSSPTQTDSSSRAMARRSEHGAHDVYQIILPKCFRSKSGKDEEGSHLFQKIHFPLSCRILL